MTFYNKKSNTRIDLKFILNVKQQLKAITKEGTALVSRYDTEGLRAEIEENEKLTKFIFHKENVLVEADKDWNVVSRFSRGYEVVAADVAEVNNHSDLDFSSNINRFYYTTDEQGSTIFVTDKNQEIKNEYWYDAFGNVLEVQEEVHNRITYTGQQFDGVTGQYYLRARFYNPVIGRFTQEDTYRGDGLNLYAYCGNNPVTYYDPSGFVCRTKYNAYKEGRDKGLSPKDAHDYMKEKLAKGGSKSSRTEIQRSKWKEYTGTDPVGEVHYGLPEQYHDWFKEHGIEDINSGEFYFDLDKGTHRLKADNGIHTNNSKLGDNWNSIWRKWIKQNPEAGLQDITNQLDSMSKKAGIEKYRAKPK
ncbi:RHS repeat-associated core domain-containing protein [Clostridium saccharobutylicum]|uniref:tRNA(Glu)-specific nuclease WapA n=1 Tax=Clostridium saccharobutylicum TaxID=169679 RepID=A0A1S8MQ40_CLOSA|nr:tRNA(Glu)-specific nuclease WapA precursor [Clostridium saccharobutylicum]